MFAFIEGKIEYLKPTEVVLNAAGVGYRLRISLGTYARIEPLAGTTTVTRLLTHHQIREDAWTLFGFYTPEELEVFELLISVSGVGGSIGLQMLSAMEPAEVASAIQRQDTALFKRVKGVGTKTAERIIVDLKDKVAGLQTLKLAPVGDGDLKLPPINSFQIPVSSAANDAILALLTLGLNRAEAEKRVAAVLKINENLTVADIIREALK